MRPIAGGVALAALAALAFGATTPVVAWAGAGCGPFAIAALLYAGAALGALALRRVARTRERPLDRRAVPRVLAIAIVGGAVAPALYAYGLQHTGPTLAALLLNLEAPFTIALAWLAFAEPIGRRVVVAAAAMTAGGVALVASTAGAEGPAAGELAGVLAVAGATLAWAADNTLARPLADHDPLAVIAAKGTLGAALTGALAIGRGEPVPSAAAVAILLATGATGYGASLRLYLLAQRRLGAARTGSVFALAPFVGAALAIALGDRALGAPLLTLGAALAFALGVVLHATEHHHHPHVHPALDHDHAHQHPDPHHDDHVHDPAFVGAHAHPHHHDALAHDHDHAPDLHHAHPH